jgi:hypothetical protein
MSVKLDVVYVSQRDLRTAGYSINDCGPACVAMLANTAGRPVTPDQIYREAGITAKGPLAVNTLKTAGNLYGLNMKRFDASSGNDLGNLMALLNEGRPAIVLISYAPVMRAGYHESTINGGHFVTAVGYDDDSIFVHDPYWREQGGAYRDWSIDVFKNAWYQYGTQYQRIILVPGQGIAAPQEPPYPVPDAIMARIRARAMFEGSPVPRIGDEMAFKDALTWLGDWGVTTQEYAVKSGDTLGEIAEEFYGSAEYYTTIAAFNQLGSANTIKVGTRLLIPIPTAIDDTTKKDDDRKKDESSGPVFKEHPFTNQQVINAFYFAFRDSGQAEGWWDQMVAAGLGHIANNREAAYVGPEMDELTLDPPIIKSVKKRLKIT